MGISKDKLKYVLYNFKTSEDKFDSLNAKPIIDKFTQSQNTF